MTQAFVREAAGPPSSRCLNLTIASGPHNIRSALEEITAQLAGWGMSERSISTAEIVFAEVLNNIEEHAYAGCTGGIIKILLCRDAELLTCEVSDSGAAMPPGPLPGADPPKLDVARTEDLPEGGFGWVLIREMTTGLNYRRIGQENRLRFQLASL